MASKKKSTRTVKKMNDDSTGFVEIEHTVPEEVDDEGISGETEPIIVGKESADGEESGVVHESGSATISDNTIDLGIQEVTETSDPGESREIEEADRISVIEEDTIATGGIEMEADPVGIVHEKSVLERNSKQTPSDKLRMKELNKAADFMLDCLSKNIKQDFEAACRDNDIKDIGIYMLAIINRLWKAVDLYDIDLEPEWEYGVIGEDKALYCQYCEKRIIKPRNPRQIFCSNLCAKYSKEKDRTGIIQPNESYDGTEAEMDAIAWEREQQQLGAN